MNLFIYFDGFFIIIVLSIFKIICVVRVIAFEMYREKKRNQHKQTTIQIITLDATVASNNVVKCEFRKEMTVDETELSENERKAIKKEEGNELQIAIERHIETIFINKMKHTAIKMHTKSTGFNSN